MLAGLISQRSPVQIRPPLPSPGSSAWLERHPDTVGAGGSNPPRDTEPSTSGLGRCPFKAVARVRIPSALLIPVSPSGRASALSNACNFGRIASVGNSNEYMRAYMWNRRKDRRETLLAMLGGRCAQCGSTTDLDFDHIDPRTKVFQLSGAGLDRAWAVILAEAGKCQILCRTDHIEKTRAEFFRAEHGTEHMYARYQCRCVDCRVAYSVKRKAYPSRWRKGIGTVSRSSTG